MGRYVSSWEYNSKSTIFIFHWTVFIATEYLKSITLLIQKCVFLDFSDFSCSHDRKTLFTHSELPVEYWQAEFDTISLTARFKASCLLLQRHAFEQL